MINTNAGEELKYNIEAESSGDFCTSPTIVSVSIKCLTLSRLHNYLVLSKTMNGRVQLSYLVIVLRGICLCWWTIRVPEDTCHQGVFLSTSVDMIYCGWRRSIRTFKSIFPFVVINSIEMVNCGLFSTIPLGLWHIEI